MQSDLWSSVIGFMSFLVTAPQRLLRRFMTQFKPPMRSVNFGSRLQNGISKLEFSSATQQEDAHGATRTSMSYFVLTRRT